MLARIISTALLGLGLYGHAAQAADVVEFHDDRYEAYYGDVDGDGDSSDIYFKGLPKLIILHGEIATPIFTEPRQSYALIRNGSGYFYQAYTPALSDSDLASFSRLVENRDVFYTDFDNDGIRDALIRGATSERAALIVHGGKPSTSDAVGVVYTGAQSLSRNLSDRSLQLALRDVDRDGRVDIVVENSDPRYADTAYLNSSAGYPLTESIDANPSTYPATLVASTATDFRVDESGSATYTVPITIPQGVAGVMPSVALTYSSSAGNGLMGLGWNLSAGSAITRCRQTFYQDGEAKSITLTAEDRFCLDGQRLIVQGSSDYGTVNAVYKTEIDNFEYIQSKGGSAGNPSYFIVIGKDGSKRTYGGNAASRQSLGSATLTWAMNETVDNTGRNSNKIHYDFVGELTDFRLAKIRYANTRAEVVFHYEDRSDDQSSYVAGYKLDTTKRLARVEVRNNATGSWATLRNYHIRYQSLLVNNTFSRVGAIQECGASTSHCLAPVRFDWSLQDLSIASGYQFQTALTPTTTQRFCEPGFPNLCEDIPTTRFQLVDYKPADINGDGCSDLVYSLYNSGQQEFYVGWKLGNAACNGFDTGHFGGSASGPEFIKYSLSENENTALLNTLDYNSDGRADVAVKRSDSDDWDIYLAQPNQDGHWFFSVAADASVTNEVEYFVDVNADGMADAVWFKDEQIHIRKMRRGGNFPADFSKPNMFSLSTTSLTRPAQYPALPSNACSNFEEDIFYRQWIEFPDSPVMGDFNGDGKIEIVVVAHSRVSCRPSTGGSTRNVTKTGIGLVTLDGNQLSNFELISIPGTRSQAEKPQYILAQDFNGDGLTDLLYKLGSMKKLHLSDGQGLLAGQDLAIPNSVTEKHIGVYDDNMDGYPDLVYSAPSGSTTRLHTMHWNPSTESFGSAEVGPSIGSNDAFMFTDFDGNGVSDKVIVTSAFAETTTVKQMRVYRDRSAGVHNKIVAMDNGLGAVSEIQYQRLNASGDHYLRLQAGLSDREVTRTLRVRRPLPDGEPGYYWTTETVSYTVRDAQAFYQELFNPFGLNSGDSELTKPVFDLNPALYVVTRVDSSSPTAQNPNAMAAVSYQYAEAKAQAGGRGYLGFRTVKSIDHQTQITTLTQYAQRFPFTGQPEATVVTDPDGNVLSESFNAYTVSQPDNTRVYQVLLEESQEHQYATQTDINTPAKFTTQNTKIASTITRQDHDRYGNVTELTTDISGTVPSPNGGSPNSITQTKTVSSKYGATTDTLTLHGVQLNYAQLGRLTSSTSVGSRDATSILQKKVSFTYYSNGLLKEENVEPDITDPNSPFTLKTVHHYDVFGNEIRTEVQGWDGETTVTRESSRAYDTEGRYLRFTYDGNGNTLEAYSDFNAYGTPQTVTSANGTVVTLDFDILNREISRRSNQATENTVSTRYLRCAEVVGCPTGTQFVVETQQEHSASSRQYLDALGRTLRSAKQDFHGRWVYVDTRYDILGRQVAVSEPHTGSARYWTTTEYDALGRALKVTAPAAANHNGGEAETTFSYNGPIVTTTNPLSRKKIEAKNALGELVWVKDDIANESHAHLRYLYNAEGNMTRVEKYPANSATPIVTTLDYDRHNRKIAMTDPDKGHWTYEHNAFNELIRQTDGKGQIVVNRYDLLGRMTTRTDYRAPSQVNEPLINRVEGHTRWYFDGATDQTHVSANHAIGQVSATVMSRSAAVESCTNTSATQCVYPTYDNKGRQIQTTTYLDSDLNPNTALEAVTTRVELDPLTGRVARSYDALDGKTDVAGNTVTSGVESTYNRYGYLSHTTDLQTGTVMYQTASVNPRGQVTEAYVGGLGRQLDYDPATGRLERQIAFVGGLGASDQPSALTIQHATYTWDILGNLESRHNQNARGNGSNHDLQESFCYDSLNRLIKTHVGDLSGSCNLSSSQQDLRYDSIGNITFKSGVGNYSYDATKKHAARNMGGRALDYDNNGNVITDGKRTFSYATFDKPTEISSADYRVQFAYGIDRARYVQREYKNNNTSPTKITAYLGNIERIFRPADNTYEWRRQVVTGIITTTTDQNFVVSDDPLLSFIFKDHLGSVDVIVGAEGSVIQSMSFDPWGARRHENSSLSLLSVSELFNFDDSLTSRGYTGHEMLDELGIIHMNGRIYDAKFARFLQADPFVQAASDVQMYNRYAYLRNNPLNATDPSGYFLKKLHRHHMKITGQWATHKFLANHAPWLVPIIATALNFIPIVGQIASAAFSANHNFYLSGSLTRATIAFATSVAAARAFSAIGSARQLGKIGMTQQVMLHGMVGGVSSVLQGGKFGHGFASAGFSAAVSASGLAGPAGEGIKIRGLVVSMLAGGTASRISGGKFANGAVTAAMGYIFNRTEHEEPAEENAQKRKVYLDFSELDESSFNGLDPNEVKASLIDKLTTDYAGYNIEFVEGSGFPIFSKTIHFSSAIVGGGLTLGENGILRANVYVGSIVSELSRSTYHELNGGSFAKLNASLLGTAIGNVASHELGHRFGLEHYGSGYLMSVPHRGPNVNPLNWSSRSREALDAKFN